MKKDEFDFVDVALVIALICFIVIGGTMSYGDGLPNPFNMEQTNEK